MRRQFAATLVVFTLSVACGDTGESVGTVATAAPASTLAATPSTTTSAPAASVSPATTRPLTTETSPATTIEPGLPAVICGQADPVELGFDPFYVHYCDAAGISVLASSEVSLIAVERTAEIVVGMIGHRPDIIQAMVDNDLRVGVIGHTEVTSDMPEYVNIYEEFPGTDWDTRSRGLGATPFIPLSTVGEENVLCLIGDTYAGESIMVHEFAHTIQVMGLEAIDPSFSLRLEDIFNSAMAAGLWANTYAATNAVEYFAEAVQSYFDTNQRGPDGGDGVHNAIDTRVELAAYDPAIFELIDDLFRAAGRVPAC